MTDGERTRRRQRTFSLVSIAGSVLLIIASASVWRWSPVRFWLVAGPGAVIAIVGLIGMHVTWRRSG